MEHRSEKYWNLFKTELGQQVLIDILQQLFWLPGAEDAWQRVNGEKDVEILRNYAVWLLGAGGLNIFTIKGNATVVRKLLEVPPVENPQDGKKT